MQVAPRSPTPVSQIPKRASVLKAQGSPVEAEVCAETVSRLLSRTPGTQTGACYRTAGLLLSLDRRLERQSAAGCRGGNEAEARTWGVIHRS